MEFVKPAIVPGEIPQPDFKQSPFWKVTGQPVSVFVHSEFPLSVDLIHTILLFQQESIISLLLHRPVYSVHIGDNHESEEATHNIINLDFPRNEGKESVRNGKESVSNV